jgi:hypothetical protein
MSQNDFVINNASFPATRADLTSALQALASNSSGSSDPTTTYANMFYYDTSDNILKMRTEADDAWVNIGYLGQGSDTLGLLDDTKVVNTSGVQTGLLGDQATSTWEAGTATTESLVSPAKIKSAIDSLVAAGSSPVGVGQTWAVYTRNRGTAYRNTTGRVIQVNCALRVTSVTVSGAGTDTTYTGSASFEISSDNSTWLEMPSGSTPIIPDDYYYRWTGDDDNNPDNVTLAFATFTELR